METTVTLPAIGFIRLRQVLAVYPVGKTTWWNGVRSGVFPPAYKIGPNATAWRVEDIRTLIESVAEGQR